METKMFDIEACVLIGLYSLAGQSKRVSTRCFYVKVAYLSHGEYSLVDVINNAGKKVMVEVSLVSN